MLTLLESLILASSLVVSDLLVERSLDDNTFMDVSR